MLECEKKENNYGSSQIAWVSTDSDFNVFNVDFNNNNSSDNAFFTQANSRSDFDASSQRNEESSEQVSLNASLRTELDRFGEKDNKNNNIQEMNDSQRNNEHDYEINREVEYNFLIYGNMGGGLDEIQPNDGNYIHYIETNQNMIIENSKSNVDNSSKSLKKRGRRKKGEANRKCIRTKMSTDNMINKIKVKFFEALRVLINKTVKYEQKIHSTDKRSMELKKLNSKLSGQINMGKMKYYLKNPIKYMYLNEPISERYNQQNKSFNEGIIEYIEQKEFPLSNYLLNLKGEYMYNIFIGKIKFPEEVEKKLHESVKAFNFMKDYEMIMDKDKDKEYLNMLLNTAVDDFLPHYENGKARNKRTKTKK